MHREIRELELAELWRPAPGAVAGWVRGVIFSAALAMVGVAAASARALWKAGGHASGLDGFWFRNGLAIAVAGVIAAAFLPRARVTRFVRLAALLPIVLAAGMLAAWGLWALVDPALPFLWHSAPLVVGVPIYGALLAMASATAVAALAVRRRRAVTWTRAVVVVALLELLLLGLWLPIVSWWWGSRPGMGWHRETLELSLGSRAVLVAVALAPPIAIAAAFSALASHRPALVRRTRGGWTAALGLLFAGAVMARLVAPGLAYLVYANLVHFLAASAFVAAAALAAFVAALALRVRRARRRLADDRAVVRGVIADDRDHDAGEDPRGVVACLEIEGWLRGPRALVDSFEVATAAGHIPIPIGAELAAPLPALSTVLHVGESVAVLRRGDRVAVAGLVEPPADHPFRGASVLIPGPDGVVVGSAGDGGGGFASIALVAWRPCVALLAILIAVALPGLAAVIVLP